MTNLKHQTTKVLKACLRHQGISKTIVFLLLLLFSVTQLVLGYLDSCNCLIVSGLLHFCYTIDLGTHAIGQSYNVVSNLPQGLRRLHLLIRLANLYFMVFLCVECALESIFDEDIVADIRPSAVVFVLVGSFFLIYLSRVFITKSVPMARTHAHVPRSDGVSTGFVAKASAVSLSLSDMSPSTTQVSTSSTFITPSPTLIVYGGSIPVKVGPMAFFAFAIAKYVASGIRAVKWADAVFTALAVVSVLARSSGNIRNYTNFFLQSNSKLKRNITAGCLKQIETLSGVIEYHSEHFWVVIPGLSVASLCIRIQSYSDARHIEEEVRKILAPHFSKITIQIEKDPESLAQVF